MAVYVVCPKKSLKNNRHWTKFIEWKRLLTRLPKQNPTVMVSMGTRVLRILPRGALSRRLWVVG